MNQDLEAIIKHHDSIFWKGLNSCNLNILKNQVSDELEFYHDKDGLTKGAETFLKYQRKTYALQKVIGDLRHKAVESSIEIHPINNYGAIITGNHVFILIKITSQNT
ncbi:hypothetical protein Q4Q39_01690 [Flavivirga amylovorans]|uniref:DUF4440 domain-containing protein n=1 Tax=Flavivirga amylovorans TaxID=870486 RepID=A0ABT8WWR3_9FLAO|nr:hypothetical protein [Flavivirga amylovorans]MDO5986105.1 hypothetical protein [Flavivirga amylovorans]